MKSILVSLVLLISSVVAAQNTLELLQATMDLFGKEDYRSTIPAAEKAIAAVKKDFGEQSPFISGLTMFIAVSYFRLYELEKAETYFLKQKEMVAATSGKKDPSYISCLNSLGLLYREKGDFKKSEAYYQETLTIVQSVYGTKDTTYAKGLNNMASLYQYMGQYTKAAQMFLQSAQLFKQVTGEKSAGYLSAQNNLATLYQEMGLFQKANPVFISVVAGRKNLLGELHPDYAQSLNNLAQNFSSLGNYKEAEKNFQLAIEMYKKAGGTMQVDYATTLNNFGQLYLHTGEYEKALELYTTTLEIRKKLLGPDHPDYAVSLNNLGTLYQQTGQYELAEQYLTDAKLKLEKNPGKNHPDYITQLNNLAGLYQSQGQYARAEPLFIEAKDIRKKVLGEKHPRFAISLNNLGTLYQEMGQYAKAEELYNAAATILKTELGVNHPDYALCLHNLAALYEATENFVKSEILYLQAADIRKKLLGQDHYDYAGTLNNLSLVYASQKQYDKAKQLLIQAAAIWKKTVGENHPMYATSLNNMAAIYRKSKTNYPEAERLYLQAIEIRKKTLGIEHPFTAESQADLALLYLQIGRFKNAEPLLVQSNKTVQKNVASAFTILSEEEKANFLKYNLSSMDINNSLLYNNPASGKTFAKSSLELLLGYKSMSLAATRNMLRAVRNSSDTALKRLLQNWITQKKTLSKQYSLPSEHRSNNLKYIELETELLEKEITRKSSAFRDQQGSLQVTMNAIQQNLAPDEAAIEFVNFKLYRQGKTDSAIYAAYIIRKTDSTPIFIPLCEKQQLKKLFDSAGQSATTMVSSFYRGLEIKASTATLGKSLYKLVWQPLDPYLKDIKKISYSPAGKLYSVAFHALQADSGVLLMDKYNMQQYTSTRQIAFRNNTKSNAAPGEMVLFGDAEFSMDSLQITRLRKGNTDAVLTTPSVFKNENLWHSLPGTGTEVNKIKQLFEQNKIKTKVYTKTAATEENLKSLNNSLVKEIHIATHGFFLPEKDKEENIGEGGYKFSDDPLLRSGLVLTGGNYVWSGKSSINGVEDGIVTAYEISQLNLINTQLVVLSACETALGDVKGSEGVFGLQRAFKIAGIKNIIVSLWQVPDKETAELMVAFYTYWFKGKSISDAFYQPQTDMRKKYSPFYWAAFVLVE
jgi:CHAT domain-containing protein/tetratricopeptide (TPR) repeat protein